MSDSTCTLVPAGQYFFGRQSRDGHLSPSWVIQAQAPSTFGVVVMVMCFSMRRGPQGRSRGPIDRRRDPDHRVVPRGRWTW